MWQRFRARCLIARGLLLCVLALLALHSEAGGSSLRSSPLVQLAETLRSAPYPQQQRFVRLAIEELIAEYELAVVDAAYEASTSPGRSRRSRQWRASTETFLGQLRQLERAIDGSPALGIHVDPQRAVHLFIGSEAVTLDSPFLNRSSVLGDRIQKGYCLQEHCAGTVAAGLGPQGLLYGVWSFGDDQRAVLSTTAGVQCVFLDVTDRRQKEALCKQVAGELGALVEALYGYQRSGRVIEWQHLAVRNTSPVRQERVVLHRRGESLPLDLPVLGRLGALPESIRNWLRRRVEGGQPELVLSQADGDLSGLLTDRSASP